MDKRQQRTRNKRATITRKALELFTTYGVDKVSMDEIADAAHVSKVTIYKYFGSKDALYAEAITLYLDELIAETEAVFNSDLDFFEKIKYAVLTNVNSSQLVSWDYLLKVWESDKQLAADMSQNLEGKVKAMMLTMVNEGKRLGYIEEHLSFNLIYSYAEIFRAGLQTLSATMPSLLTDKETLDPLLHLHFFGLIKRQ